jgi:membrane protease YdiL (CAAX protease family)
MTTVHRFADRKPFLFVLATFIAWLAFVTIFGILTGSLLALPFSDPLIQAAGTLIATAILLFMVFRLGWIGEIGILNLGGLDTWGITFVLAVYVILVNFYAYFGEITFQLPSLRTQEAIVILLRSLQVGFVEEVVFRGIILYGLARVWGKSKRGLVAALIVQGILFGIPHALQTLAGTPLTSATSNMLATSIFGVWVGALVVSVGTLWPAILLHAAANALILIEGLSSPWINPNYLGYLRASLFELPLVLLGLWFALKFSPESLRGLKTASESAPSV